MSIMSLAKRIRRDEEDGFTLIELMVVVLIIAILIAIAIPTFLGARRRAQDRAAQSTARNTLTAAKTLFTDGETYAPATVGALEQSEPSITFWDQATPSEDPNEASVGPEGAFSFYAAVYSKSGYCFYLKDTQGPINTTGLGTTYYREDLGDDETNCTADYGETNGTFTTTGWTTD